MTVKYNRNLGVYQVNGRGAYATEEEAKAADEAAAQGTNIVDDGDFASSMGQPTGAQAAEAPAYTPRSASSTTPTKPKPAPLDGVGKWQWTGTDWTWTGPQQAFNSGNIGGAGGVTNVNGQATADAFEKTHQTNQGGVDWGKVGDFALDAGTYALDPIGGTARVVGNAVGGPVAGYLAQMASGPAGAIVGAGSAMVDARQRGQATMKGLQNGATGSAAGAGAPGGAAPAGTTQEQLNRNTSETQSAENKFEGEQAKNAEENDSLFSGAMDRFNNLGGGDYLAADDARGIQQEGLQQQRQLLEKLLGFDEEQYAAQFGDQTLSRMIAAGRQGTSAAEQQAGRFAALEQAPAVYAEGRRQASELANQRLAMAETAATNFGQLGTATRGQDETRAQFEAQLPLEIANSVAALSQGKMNLNQQESEMFGQMWMDFAQLQSVYAGMSSGEQIAWWREESARRGQDKAFEGIMAQIKANGAVTDKDLINGLFQLGGGLLGLGGRLGAA